MTAEDGASPRSGRVCAGLLGVCIFAAAMVAIAGAVGVIGQSQTLQAVVLVFGFVLVLPAVALIMARLGATGRDPAGLLVAAVGASGLVLGMIAILRLASVGWGDGTLKSVICVLFGLAAIAAVLALIERVAPAGRPPPKRVSDLAGALTPAALSALGLAASSLVFLIFAPSQVSAPAALVALLLGAAAYVGIRRGPRFELPKQMLLLCDLAVLVLIALLAINLSGYWGADVIPAFNVDFYNEFSASTQVQQHFFLGSVNDIVHGRALLVDANSVYGISSAYLVALWFKIVPLNYGMFWLFGGLMSFAYLAVGWAIARAAGATRILAAGAIVIGALLTILAVEFPPAGFPNLGGLRFCPPLILVAVAMLTCRDGGSASRPPWVLVTLGFFTTWSIDGLVYCLGAYVALAMLDAMATRSWRQGTVELVKSGLAALAAFVAAHVAFGVITLIFAGSWPDWGMYVRLFKAWSDVVAGAFGTTVANWSRSWLVAGLYAGSALAVCQLALSDRAILPRRSLIAIAGLTGTGVAFLTYFISHTYDLYLLYTSVPALFLVAIWLSAAFRIDAAALPWRRFAAGTATVLATMLIAGSWGAVRPQLSTTALAHLLPGDPPLKADAEQLWDPPAILLPATGATNLINEYFPPDRALVLVDPDLGQEALIRSGRANLLPISYPFQDEYDMADSLPPVEKAVDNLEPGTMGLFQDPPPPGTPRTAQQLFGNVPDGARLGPLAQAAYDRILERFRLQRVAAGPDGLYVARLVPRDPASTSADDG
jgi:hypothetical protein